MSASTNGRRILVAVVTGDVGERITAWRQEFDPDQARRLPPHATLAYWAIVAPDDEDRFDAQIRHAFPGPIPVRLGEVHQFDNPDATLYVDVQATDALDEARARLFDGTHFAFPEQLQEWDWHVTVVRYGIKADMGAIRPHLDDLRLHDTWVVDTIAWLELRDGVYHELRRWELVQSPA